MRQNKRKGVKKNFQWGNRTRDLLICSPSSLPPQGLIASRIDCTYQTYPPTYTANLNGHELRVASLAALISPINAYLHGVPDFAVLGYIVPLDHRSLLSTHSQVVVLLRVRHKTQLLKHRRICSSQQLHGGQKKNRDFLNPIQGVMGQIQKISSGRWVVRS